MSSSPTDKRVDPLIDAYRQASELEATSSGAKPRAALRAAVLAHARVVAQSAVAAEPKLAVSETVRATPAANDARPIWRIAAGVVLGVVGLWVYQLTRPGSTDEANVAVLSAPQSAKASSNEATVAAAAPSAASVASVASAAVTAPTNPVTVAAPAQAETAIAVATPSRADKTARDTSARDRMGATSDTASISAPRDSVADAARSEKSVALAKADAPARRTEQAGLAAAPPAVAAAAPVAPATTSAIPEAAPSEPLGETMIASAEMRKAARPSVAARASVAAAPGVAAAPPNAFPATATGAMAAAAPPPAAPAAVQQSAAAGGNSALRQGIVSTPDAAMFSAVRIGNVNAFRAALARGANVNARDEGGRSALQIARERSDADMVKALELAGAKQQ